MPTIDQDTTILRDVQLRLMALQDAHRLRPMVDGALTQLQQAKERATHSQTGSLSEQQYLREAAEASERLAALRERLYAAERELRRTTYLLELLSD